MDHPSRGAVGPDRFRSELATELFDPGRGYVEVCYRGDDLFRNLFNLCHGRLNCGWKGRTVNRVFNYLR